MVSVEYLEADKNSSDFRCELTPDQFLSVLKLLLVASRGRLASWLAQRTGTTSFPELVKAVNRVKLPGRKTEITYNWSLRSYRDFAILTEMAARSEYGEVLQSLFQFEFAGGKKGQLDLAANKKGGFKLWLSFDSRDDQAAFTRLTGIKLKERH